MSISSISGSDSTQSLYEIWLAKLQAQKATEASQNAASAFSTELSNASNASNASNTSDTSNTDNSITDGTIKKDHENAIDSALQSFMQAQLVGQSTITNITNVDPLASSASGGIISQALESAKKAYGI